MFVIIIIHFLFSFSPFWCYSYFFYAKFLHQSEESKQCHLERQRCYLLITELEKYIIFYYHLFFCIWRNLSRMLALEQNLSAKTKEEVTWLKKNINLWKKHPGRVFLNTRIKDNQIYTLSAFISEITRDGFYFKYLKGKKLTGKVAKNWPEPQDTASSWRRSCSYQYVVVFCIISHFGCNNCISFFYRNFFETKNRLSIESTLGDSWLKTPRQ